MAEDQKNQNQTTLLKLSRKKPVQKDTKTTSAKEGSGEAVAKPIASAKESSPSQTEEIPVSSGKKDTEQASAKESLQVESPKILKLKLKRQKPKPKTKLKAKAEEPKTQANQKDSKEQQDSVKEAIGSQAQTEDQKTETQSDIKTEKAKLETKEQKDNSIKLEGLFAFKMSMTTFYNEKGESIPVTGLKYEPCRISQIKSEKKESYNAVQVAFKAQKNKRCSKALRVHLRSAGFKEGARFIKEIRQTIPEGIKLGQEVSIESLKRGDFVKISSLSKGRGFTGVMKRWNFAGGKASHGSKSHRRIGSIGQHTEPSRVMPGRKMPGQHGFKQVSYLKVPIVDVLPEEGMIFVKGPVPGARNTLVSLSKMSNPSS